MNLKIPKDFTLRYRFSNGSLPPPDHYEYTLTLKAPDKGKIVFYAGYPSENTPPKEETFLIDPSRLQNLYGLFQTLDIPHRHFEEDKKRPTGGECRFAEVSFSGETFVIPADIQPAGGRQSFFEVIESFIPQERIQRLRGG